MEKAEYQVGWLVVGLLVLVGKQRAGYGKGVSPCSWGFKGMVPGWLGRFRLEAEPGFSRLWTVTSFGFWPVGPEIHSLGNFEATRPHLNQERNRKLGKAKCSFSQRAKFLGPPKLKPWV